jgi:hypothetical protein
MDIFDETTNTMAHTVTAGPAQELIASQVIDLSFTPWNGYQDGHTYNISYRAELDDGTPSGTPRYFHATFASDIDVAILSDKTTGTSAIVEDLKILGKSYTQFAINDWDEYFKGNWFTHYDKIVLPWQDSTTASDSGDKYYQRLYENDDETVDRKQILTAFMQSGGTIQAHLAPHGSQTYGSSSTTIPNRLPLDLDIGDRVSSSKQITYAKMEIYDPYHPILNDIDDTNNYAIFQGINSGVVATSALEAGLASEQADWASGCTGNLDNAEFQPIIQDSTSIGDVLLGLCSYGQGGMIISTIDVESNSENASSTTFPLLRNMLLHQVNDYPNPFSKQREGTDILINGEKPLDALGSGYLTHYMKSNAEVTFSYQSDATVDLFADWVIEGPTSWDGSSLAIGEKEHYVPDVGTLPFDTEVSPVVNFCKSIGTQGLCKQDVQWTITLWLHDENGHSRQLSVVVETDDANADEFNPVADAYVEIRDDYADNLELIGSSGSNNEWEKYRITLDDDGQIPIYFNASGSYDEDAPQGSTGIKTYKWEVFYDKAQDEVFSTTANTYTQSAASQGIWMYTFGGFGVDENGESYAGRNLTVDEDTKAITQPIKVVLTVFDEAGNWDDEMEIYFEVIPAGFGDVAPTIQLNGWQDVQGFTDSNFTLTGSVLSGSDGDVYIEMSLKESIFTADSSDRIAADSEGTFVKVTKLSNSDTFSLTLNMDSYYTNKTEVETIYLYIYEFTSNTGVKRWADHDYGFTSGMEITLTLPICRGLTVPNEVLAVDDAGYWAFIGGECQWVGDWKFENGEWIEPSSDSSEDSAESGSSALLLGGGALILIVILALTFLFLKKSDSEGMDGMVKDFSIAGGYQQDPVEQYVQQLIAQGYPEETARSYASQYAAQAGGASATAAASQPAAASNPAMDAAYQQYYQQFISQGYDQQTAAAYAQQYAAAYIQQQG